MHYFLVYCYEINMRKIMFTYVVRHVCSEKKEKNKTLDTMFMIIIEFEKIIL